MGLNARGTKIGRTLEAADQTGLVVRTEEHSILGPECGCAEVMSGHRSTPLLRVWDNGGHVESVPNDELLWKYGRTVWHVADAAWSHLAKGRE